MFRAGERLQVFESVVRLVSVPVVDFVAFQYRTVRRGVDSAVKQFPASVAEVSAVKPPPPPAPSDALLCLFHAFSISP